jgi:hypothetical protein
VSFAVPRVDRAARMRASGDHAAVPRALTLLAILLVFALSPMALDWMGLDYDEPTGNPLTKIHPGTVVAGFALLAWVVALGLRGFMARLLAYPGLVAFVAATVFLMVYDLAAVREPVTPLIDTYAFTFFLMAALLLDPKAPSPGLRLVVHAFFAANALLGLAEFLFKWRLFPIEIGIFGPVDDWRSSALFGHPLTNSILVATYIVVLLSGGHGFGPRARMAMIFLQLAALVVFGGRTALVISLGAGGVAILVAALRVLRGGRMRVGDVILVALVVPLLALFVGILAERGFFDLLIERFVSDAGSAQTRIIMLHLLQELSWNDFLFGADRGVIATLVQMEGLEYGIESFEVAMIIKYGAVPCLLFFAGLLAVVLEVVRNARPTALLPFGCFFAIASTSLSIAEKTPQLGMAAAVIFILMRDPPITSAG